MGLCKCQKNTQNYCFVHLKHICPNCVQHHPNCTVRTYMEWLEDSEHDWPCICTLCDLPLVDNDTIRLPCLGTLRHLVPFLFLETAALSNQFICTLVWGKKLNSWPKIFHFLRLYFHLPCSVQRVLFITITFYFNCDKVYIICLHSSSNAFILPHNVTRTKS